MGVHLAKFETKLNKLAGMQLNVVEEMQVNLLLLTLSQEV